MPTWIEIRLACQGLMKIARFDPDFVRYFDRSTAGAMRSFWVAAAIYPYFMLNVWISLSPDVPSQGRYLVAMTVAYILSWMAVPLLLLALTQVLQRDAEVVGCIAIYNWVSLLWSLMALPLMVFELIPLSPPMLGNFDLLYLLIVSVFEWFVLRHALRITPLISVGLVVADIFINQFVIFPVLASAATGS